MTLWKILTKIKRIKISGHWHKVIFPYKFKSNEKNLIGQCNHTNLTIKVVDSFRGVKMSKSRIEETFLHEIIHCISYHYCYAQLREKQVVHLSEGLYQCLSDANLLKE